MFYKFDFKKQFGQNFLRNKKIIYDLISSIEPSQDDLIIEIGPGDGGVTEALLGTGAKVTSVEIDRDLLQILQKKFKDRKNFNLVQKDILQFFPNEHFKERQSYKVIGSLPYNISKKIIKKFIELEDKPKIMAFIVQKEVAKNYTAEVPKATFLSNFVSIFYQAKYVGPVRKSYFVPKPKVDGAIIKFELKEKPAIAPEEYQAFTKFLFNCFRQPRKKLKNVLKAIYKDKDWEEIFRDNKIDLNSRASELTINNIFNLFYTIKL